MDYMIFIIFGIIILFGGALFIFINKSLPKGDRKSFLAQSDKETVQRKWQDIQQLIHLGGESRNKHAVLEADKLVDFTLKKMEIKGDKMADRMKASQDRFSSYDIYSDMWEAHKCRNKIVHEIEHELLHHEAKKNILRFEKTLRDLGGL